MVTAMGMVLIQWISDEEKPRHFYDAIKKITNKKEKK
jgi:hypothetical protein